MERPLLHERLLAVCPHGGQVKLTSSESRVTVSGGTAVRAPDTNAITGCAFWTPCIKVRWTRPSRRITIRRKPAVHRGSVGLCLNAAEMPQGPVIFTWTQMRARGS